MVAGTLLLGFNLLLLLLLLLGCWTNSRGDRRQRDTCTQFRVLHEPGELPRIRAVFHAFTAADHDGACLVAASQAGVRPLSQSPTPGAVPASVTCNEPLPPGLGLLAVPLIQTHGH